MCNYLRIHCRVPLTSTMLNLCKSQTSPKKKKVSISPHLLRLSFSTTTERVLNASTCSTPYSFAVPRGAHMQSHTDTRTWLSQIQRAELSTALTPIVYALNSWWFCNSGTHRGLEAAHDNALSFIFFSYMNSWRDGPAALLAVSEEKPVKGHGLTNTLSTLTLYNSLSLLLQFHRLFPNFPTAFDSPSNFLYPISNF